MGRRRAVQGCLACQRVAGWIHAGCLMLTLAIIAISTVLTAVAVVPVVPFPIVAVTMSAISVSLSMAFNLCVRRIAAYRRSGDRERSRVSRRSRSS